MKESYICGNEKFYERQLFYEPAFPAALSAASMGFLVVFTFAAEAAAAAAAFFDSDDAEMTSQT